MYHARDTGSEMLHRESFMGALHIGYRRSHAPEVKAKQYGIVGLSGKTAATLFHNISVD
jgi:hypothetical protein